MHSCRWWIITKGVAENVHYTRHGVVGRHFRWADLSGRLWTRLSGGIISLTEAPQLKSLSLTLGGKLCFNQEFVQLKCVYGL